MLTPDLDYLQTNTRILRNSCTQTNTVVGQRSSQTLLLNLIHNIAILYLMVTLLSIPIWVMSGISFGRFLQIQQTSNNEIDKFDYLLIFTSGNLLYFSDNQENDHISQIAQITSEILINSNNSNQKLGLNEMTFINTGNINSTESNRTFLTASNTNSIISVQSFLSICLWVDCILQIIFVIGCGILQYISFNFKLKHKGNHIQDYSLQVTGLPLIHPHVVLPRLQQHLITNLHAKFQMVADNIEILDIVSAYAQQQYRQLVLRNQLNQRLSQQQCQINIAQLNDQQSVINDRIKEVKEMLPIVDTKHARKDTLWITFETRQARYLAFRFIQSKSTKFMNHFIHVQKAPHPSQIIWANLHTPSIRVFGSQIISLVICMGLLLLFDLLILYIHKQSYNIILASVTIFLLEVLLKEIIIMTVTKIQKHKYISKMSLSLLCKLSKFLYINTALIIFISSFNIGSNSFARTFSICQFNRINLNWFKHVGLSIMLNFVIQIIYVNVRPTVQIIKHHIITKVVQFIKNIISGKLFREQQPPTNKKQQKLKSQLDICYAHIISAIMFANTFSFTHPIFYPLSAICMLIAFYTHRKYIAHFTQPAPYNNDDLNDTAIQYIYGSIVMHWIILFIGYGFLPGLILACVGACILFSKNTLISKISDLVRRKLGPFCFSQFERIHTSSTPLLSLLTSFQISQYILYLHHKNKMYTNIYNSKSEKQDLVSKSYLRQCVRGIQDKINKLQKLKENADINKPETNSKMMRIQQRNQSNKINNNLQIKGTINYQMPQHFINL